MIKLEKTVRPSGEQWEAIIRGMRNPMNSWEKSDTGWVQDTYNDNRTAIDYDDEWVTKKVIGPNDLDLMMKLRNAGTDHRKFMRMIIVYVDITAPLYWWKEFDTYKVGTVANSCSTMHKIHAKEFTLEDFSHEDLADEGDEAGVYYSSIAEELLGSLDVLKITVDALNVYRKCYLETNVFGYWRKMIQLLPSSYNQKRTVMLNYEVLANIYKSRKNHKLKEWRDLCEWIEGLPYSELITGGCYDNEVHDAADS